MKRQVPKNNKGFSLVELIVVIAIIAILSGFLAVLYVQHLKEARAAVCLENRDRLYEEMNTTYADGTYDSLDEAYDKKTLPIEGNIFMGSKRRRYQPDCMQCAWSTFRYGQ